MIIRWFISKKVREAVAMRQHVRKLLNAQRDILSPQAIAGIQAAMAALRKTVAGGADKAALKKEMENMEKAADRWLKPYPHPAWRENVEVLLVALAVAMGIRTFFLQPFKIPTGSMQPTLWGVTSTNLIDHPEIKFPTGLARIRDWFHGTSYVHLVAQADGPVEIIERPWPAVIFSIYQRVRVAGKWQFIWFPPDYGSPPAGTLEARAGLVDQSGRLKAGQFYRKGQDIVRMRVNAGDHLFVDRMTYNFRRPRRGEIIVFETKGIDESLRSHFAVPGNQFYIKRLVALGEERVSIGADHHLSINNHRLDASTPGFEFVYTFGPNAGDNEYFGHLPTGIFSDVNEEYQLRRNHLMVMGDNTRNSLDSRFFGDFAREYVIGKSWFVYWPISSRFGVGYR